MPSPLESLDAATRAPLEEFRRAFPPRTVEAGGSTWQLIEASGGQGTLLVLPGLLGAAEGGWLSVSRLAALGRRVLAPSYPPALASMDALADGLAALLAVCAVERCTLVGASYGGLVAQALARRHPALVAALILAHTGAPQPHHARRLRHALTLYARMPESLLHAMLHRQIERRYRWIAHPYARLTAAQMQESLQQMEKAAILTGYLRQAEQGAAWAHAPGTPYAGPTLLIFGARDPATPRRTRAALTALYPQAETHTFRHSGHATALVETDAYIALLAAFADRHA